MLVGDFGMARMPVTLIGAYRADRLGNLDYRKSSRAYVTQKHVESALT